MVDSGIYNYLCTFAPQSDIQIHVFDTSDVTILIPELESESMPWILCDPRAGVDTFSSLMELELNRLLIGISQRTTTVSGIGIGIGIESARIVTSLFDTSDPSWHGLDGPPVVVIVGDRTVQTVLLL